MSDLDILSRYQHCSEFTITADGLKEIISCVRADEREKNLMRMLETAAPLWCIAEAFGVTEEEILPISMRIAAEEEREAIAYINREEGFEEGFKKGLEEARKELREKERVEDIRKLLRAGAHIKFITEAYGVSEDEVRQIDVDARTCESDARMVDGVELS